MYHSLWVKINLSLEKYGIHPFIHPLTHSKTLTEYLFWSSIHSTNNREHKDIRRHNYSEGFVTRWAKCHLARSTALKNQGRGCDERSGWIWPRTWGFPLFPAGNLGIQFHELRGADCQCLPSLHPNPPLQEHKSGQVLLRQLNLPSSTQFPLVGQGSDSRATSWE